MNRKNVVLAGIIACLIIIGSGALLWEWVLGDTLAPSAPIAAIPATAESTNTAITAPNLKVFHISQMESQVRFTIYEELRGQPKDVVGVTDQVAGDIDLNLSNLSTTHVGEILVNARTLVTDDDRRNQAIRNRILNTDNYEFITFSPTKFIGLEGSASPGDSFTFQIAGDLTIRDTTKPVIFDVTARIDSENEINGSASTTIKRSDYHLAIPSVPFVANVSEEIALEIDFVANSSAVEGD